jgi:hypothetical protein
VTLATRFMIMTNELPRIADASGALASRFIVLTLSRRRHNMKAETIARALGGRKASGGWMARCPAHDDQNPSLSIRDVDGNVLVRCHAGCEQAHVIAALRRRGLWAENRSRSGSSTARRKPVERQPDRDARKTEAALATWHSAKPALATRRSRPISCRAASICHRPTRCAFVLA